MYFATTTGRAIDIGEISEKDICLADIAHHLTKICRFGGSLDLNKHYSVASHSLTLCYYALDHNLGDDVARWALMHDATEAYLGDVVAGLKQYIPDYVKLEDRVATLIVSKYKLKVSTATEAIVKEMDTRIVLDEAAVFMPYYYDLYRTQLKDFAPLDVPVMPDGSLQRIKDAFLQACFTLGIKD